MSECCLSVPAVALEICAFYFSLGLQYIGLSGHSLSFFFASINIGIRTVQYSILASVVSSLTPVLYLALLSCAPSFPLILCRSHLFTFSSPE